MGRKNKNMVITRSNYTVKEKHKRLEDKVFYERDFMTTTNLGGYDSSVIPYGEGNFKFIYRNNSNQGKRRRHSYGGWMETPNGDGSWTLANAASRTTGIVMEGDPKPDYHSLLDFCYFGSCVEMIKNAITEIVSNYVGELYVAYYGLAVGDHMLGDDMFANPVLVENPYSIDIVSPYRRDVSNDLRYFFKSRNKYKILDASGEMMSCFADWDVIRWDKDCYDENGDKMASVKIGERQVDTGTTQEFKIYQYYYAGKTYLITDGDIWSGFHVRPLDSVVKKYRDSLGDFERMMLNTDSNPLHTMTLDYEYEDDRGIVRGQRDFTWPTEHGWNLDISSRAYEAYVNDLLKLANYYDEKYSNNLWRMIIHDSVKNTDFSMLPEERVDACEDGASAFESLMMCYGRFFDDIKRDIDDIGKMQDDSYTVENETSQHLSEILDQKGWEVTRVTDTLDDDAFVSGLYPNSSKTYDLTEMNKTFLNYLRLNTPYLFRQKGTRKCIESVLGLFGFTSYDFAKSLYQHLPENKKSKANGKVRQWDDLTDQEKMSYYDYRLDEHVVVASNTSGDVIDSEEELVIEKYGMNEDKTYGLPVKIFYCMKTDGQGGVTEMKYMVPWFKRDMADENGTYFQMYGGWGKMQSKAISQKIAPAISEIYSDSSLTIYDETVNYVKITESVDTLLNTPASRFYDGVIYYAEDTTLFTTYNTGITDPTIYSNYLILKDKNYCNEISQRGWNPILNSDIESARGDGMKVLYLESIVDDVKGNNPHVGYSKYDSGKEYLEYFRQVFKYYINNDLFTTDRYDCTTGELYDEITDEGFTLSDLVMDNVKTWYFTDTYETALPMLSKDKKTKKSIDGVMVEVDYGYKLYGRSKPAYVGKKGVANDTYVFGSDLVPFNLETQEVNSYDEAAANSVINVKNVNIVFNPRISSYSGFKAYLYGVVVKYIKQVMPSTAIWGITIEGAETEYECFKFPQIVGFADK